MKDVGKRLFRGQMPVKLLRDGVFFAGGKGLIQELGEKADNFTDETSQRLGQWTTPLYLFVGQCPGLLAGDVPGTVLQGGNKTYTVLSARAVKLGGMELYVRAVLERRVPDDRQ